MKTLIIDFGKHKRICEFSWEYKGEKYSYKNAQGEDIQLQLVQEEDVQGGDVQVQVQDCARGGRMYSPEAKQAAGKVQLQGSTRGGRHGERQMQGL